MRTQYTFICAHCGITFQSKNRQRTYCSPSCRVAGTTRPLSDRLWEKVDRSGGADACWLWTAHIQATGYGQIWDNGRRIGAHVAAWELAHGPVPAGMFVCHRCDVRRCVNPAHLWIGTNADNLHDMFSKGRANPPRGEQHWMHRKPECIARGERQGGARLNAEAVRQIRADAARGMTQRALSKHYGVAQSTINRIIRREQWKHIA